MRKSALTVGLLNAGHAFDHLFMLIFPTAVLAIGPAWGVPYGDLLALSLGGFIAFGAGSLPAGWLGDRWSRHAMMVIFFVGIGAASILTGFARTGWQIAVGLTLIGLFAAIYHPVGIAMLVQGEDKVGRILGVNGVAGNLGVAAAALVTGALVDLVHWRAAFFVPGALSIVAGLLFWAYVPVPPAGARKAKAAPDNLPRAAIARVFAILIVATLCGGVIFNATTVAMPKVFDERLGALADTSFGVGVLAAIVFVVAALAQLCVGQMIDRGSLKSVFVLVVALQPPLLWLAGTMQDYAMFAVATAMMFFVFGQIPINDAMVAKYTNEEWRARIYAVRYLVSFGSSAAAVQMVAYLHKAGGGFPMVFQVLAVLACGTLAAALFFPGVRRQSPAPAGAG